MTDTETLAEFTGTDCTDDIDPRADAMALTELEGNRPTPNTDPDAAPLVILLTVDPVGRVLAIG